MNDAEEFNDEQALLNYDDVVCPGIGETVCCLPEVQEFEVNGELYRIVLTGKQGYSCWVGKPVFAIERKYGVDALGAIAWVDASAAAWAPMLSGLFMAVRAKLSALTAEHVAARVK